MTTSGSPASGPTELLANYWQRIAGTEASGAMEREMSVCWAPTGGRRAMIRRRGETAREAPGGHLDTYGITARGRVAHIKQRARLIPGFEMNLHLIT